MADRGTMIISIHGVLVVDGAGRDERQVLVGLGDRPDVVQRILVGLAGEDLPDGLVPAGRIDAHATIPSRRISSRASARMRLFVHTGSQTTSISTASTSGSARHASRMSSWMNSIAGQPIAV